MSTSASSLLHRWGSRKSSHLRFFYIGVWGAFIFLPLLYVCMVHMSIRFLTPCDVLRHGDLDFSYQGNVSSSRQEYLSAYSREPTFALCAFKGLTVDPDPDSGISLCDKSLAFESRCEFWKPSPTLAPDDMWPRLTMLILDLNVIRLKNKKTCYLACLENKLEGNNTPHTPPFLKSKSLPR